MFASDTLKGRHILVTGGGSGLGLAMAKRFAELGASIAICGRTEDKLLAAAEEIKAAAVGASHSTSRVITHAVDVRDHAGCGEMMQRLIREFGTIDGLVNNAAGNFLAPSEELSPNAFKSVVDIVLHGTFNCTQHFGKYLIDEGKKGTVVNIVTTYTESGGAFILPSACAKAGVYALTTSLAFEWGIYGIRVNSIAPGPFPTEGAWSRLIPPHAEKTFKERIPLGRYGEHHELANLASFLMSDLSSYMTGACVTIDGGERLAGAEFNFLAQIAPRPELKAMLAAMKPKK
jgi:NAD(P)-dependent dehydrogenase (short-subunit alcohol dehydrogenase family)